MIRGEPVPTTRVELLPDGVAKSAQMKDGDKIVSINGTRIETWDQMREMILASPNKPLEVTIERKGKQQTLRVTPAPKGEGGGGQIGVRPVADMVPMSAKAAAVRSVVEPAKVVELLVVSLARIVTGKDKPQLSGPVGIVREVGRAAQRSWADYLYLLGLLSAYLGGFNLVPFPALDGGRLMFLGYEAVTRRRPNARIEAQIHMVGLVMLLALILVVTVFDIRGN
jgi:regulator of sigma E protease